MWSRGRVRNGVFIDAGDPGSRRSGLAVCRRTAGQAPFEPGRPAAPRTASRQGQPHLALEGVDQFAPAEPPPVGATRSD